jgi:lipopolysaccharide transport system permease protein
MSEKQVHWKEVLQPVDSLFKIRFREIWEYRDLLFMFVKRDFSATYRQTVLGPLWFIIQPLMTTLMFTVVFGNFAQIKTGDQPKILFYLAGITIWNYFADSFNKTSNVFTANASIFGKVYFPRLILPISVVVSGLIRFLIQFLLFIGFLLYFIWHQHPFVHPGPFALLTPLLLLVMAGIALGSGLIISALTTKYRDFTYLIGFGVNLLMYATPIIYPSDMLLSKYRIWVLLNPLTGVVENFRYCWLGSGKFSWDLLAYSSGCMLFILAAGIIIFNRVERNFMDTV